MRSRPWKAKTFSGEEQRGKKRGQVWFIRDRIGVGGWVDKKNVPCSEQSPF